MSFLNSRSWTVSLLVLVLLLSSSEGHKTCARNADLWKTIQYQLKLAESNEGNCDCECSNKEVQSKTAFSATNSKLIQNIKKYSTVIYDKVITNYGNGYDPKTGLFTAPSDGPYFFSWTSLTTSNNIFRTYLVLNNKLMARNSADARTVNVINITGTQAVVLQLHKGDKVCIKLENGNLLYNEEWSIFSGYQI